MRKVELLAPAGDFDRLVVALRYGADAVYIGGKQFSLRSRASNFSIEEIQRAVDYTHQQGKKLYVTANMIFHNEDLPGFEVYVKQLDSMGVDALIVASIAMAATARQLSKQMEIHLSTQVSTMNHLDLEFYQSLNLDRVVLAREVELADLETIIQKTSMPLEVFIHGAMCTNYSGRCTLSNEMTNRDANRGGCAQSCRWKYRLFDQDHEISGDQLFSMSAKDMAAIRFIPHLLRMGVASLKIEGRMKSAYYLACVVRAYRLMIDLCYRQPDAVASMLPVLTSELQRAENRPTSEGFYDHIPNVTDHLYGINGSGVNHEFVGYIKSYDEENQVALVQVRNYFKIADKLELLSPTFDNPVFVVEEMYDELMLPVEVANKPMCELWVKIPFKVETNDMLRVIR